MAENNTGFQGNTERVLNEFKEILSLPPERVTEVGVTVPIPTFDESTVIELANRAKRSYIGMDTLLNIQKPVYIIGDLHGNIFDLIRVLVLSGVPPVSRFLFLGDYVDRGQYSVEVITLLLALSVRFPEHIYLLRGNHEFERVNEMYGFKMECESIYGDLKVYNALNEAFNWMPLAARVGKEIFAVHGGISPQISSFRQLRLVKRPITTYDNNIACDLLWSDPSTETKDFLRSQRGNGVTYGVNAVKDFLRQFKIEHIVRAHQCVPLGIERFAGDSVYTVFSCSNYADASGNRCGIMFVPDQGPLQLFSLPPITQIPRDKALLSGKSAQGNGQNTLSLNDVKNEVSRNSILSLNTRFTQRTYMTRKNSGIRGVVSSLSLPRSSSAQSTSNVEEANLPPLKPRPQTAEPYLTK